MEGRMSEIITTDGKNGVKLEEYNGVYSISACYNGYVQWGKMKVSKTDYADKDRPVKVVLGNKETAAQVLRELLTAIGQPDGDCPF
jgi:hypothetical protein